jgi:hypothetical protein
VELRRVLARLGRLADDARCGWPDARRVRRLVLACTRLRGAGPVLVAGGGRPWCRHADGWVAPSSLDSRP